MVIGEGEVGAQLGQGRDGGCHQLNRGGTLVLPPGAIGAEYQEDGNLVRRLEALGQECIAVVQRLPGDGPFLFGTGQQCHQLGIVELEFIVINGRSFQYGQTFGSRAARLLPIPLKICQISQR